MDDSVKSAAKGRTILCLASYFKGNDFLEQCKKEGCHVILITLEPLLGKPWVRQFIDEVYAVPSLTDRRVVVNSVSYLARTRDIARITPLDDYDVETAAHLREHLRIPGMGETTARYFRDKLAMRARAKDRDIPIPEFVHVLNHPRIHEFLERVPPPWLLKPRSEASSIGIRKLERAEEVWKCVEELGDAQSSHLLERMIPGEVCHVDAIVSERKVVFAEVHQYRKPLFELLHQGGGIFATRTVRRGSEEEKQILDTHAQVIENLGLVRGVTHTEFIRGKDDGRIYFLETAARVGGAHIADLVEASTGVNLWKEWAKIEIAQGEEPYTPPPRRAEYGGLIISLARQEQPDTSAYADPEIAWRLAGQPAHHVGFVLRSESPERVEALLDAYEPRIASDFMATMPAPSQATS
jgi:carbamoylphosphate synthase large subunit